MKTAMGWRPAIWRRFMAFPDTSSIQCLPWKTQIIKLILFPVSSPFLHLHSPCQPLLLLTVCWFHTGDCCTVQPLWICAPGSLLPWSLWRKRSGNLGRPPHSLAVVLLCLRSCARDITCHLWHIVIHYYDIINTVTIKSSTFLQLRHAVFLSRLLLLWERHSRGTQEPNLSGNSEMRSSLTRSFIGPSTMTGRV